MLASPRQTATISSPLNAPCSPDRNGPDRYPRTSVQTIEAHRPQPPPSPSREQRSFLRKSGKVPMVSIRQVPHSRANGQEGNDLMRTLGQVGTYRPFMALSAGLAVFWLGAPEKA